MPKGLFTQGVAVLLTCPVPIERAAAALTAFDIRGLRDPAGTWPCDGPGVVLSFRPEVNGVAVVDLVDRPWPDAMGGPPGEPRVDSAWLLSSFGPFTFPGSLARAAEQCWGWEPGRGVQGKHTAFLRVRLTYNLDVDDEVPPAVLMPEDCRPLPELEFVTGVAAELLALPEALCYFNPVGEVLRDAATLRASRDHARSLGLPPLDVWSNVRLYDLTDHWLLMDTVGNGQLDLPDVEVCFRDGGYDCAEVDHYLRDLSLYLLRRGEAVGDGDTLDGPGDVRWRARRRASALTAPSRPVLRLLPLDGRPVPDAALRDRAGDS
jgi:hypothetical protein